MSRPGEGELVGLARALGAGALRPVSEGERALLAAARAPRAAVGAAAAAALARGEDPLGEAFARLRSAAERRPLGATYTPAPIVDTMLRWAERAGRPGRVVDPGAGSGRFAVAAARRFPDAEIVAVELDPLAALLARGHLAAAGFADRARVIAGDFRELALRRIPRPTLYVGNPPYVRHHDIGVRWKTWLTETARRRGLPASQLSGLHVHFFLATLEHAAPGDYGVYITAAEWLDVNYGSLLRHMFLDGLGGVAIHLVEPRAQPFPDATTTAAISCFRIASRPTAISFRRAATIHELGALDAGEPVGVARLKATPRWTPLTRGPVRMPAGHVELGELCRVRRGQVTGSNAFWIAGPHAEGLPERLLVPAITRARELLRAGARLADASHLRRIVDLPVDLDVLPPDQRKVVEAFLRRARMQGVDQGYVARHRRAWWAVGLYEPAPILATYMARRPPAFVRNLARATHINIAHGLYPREPLSDAQLDALVGHLARSVRVDQGRTYAGGLTKFEPREMERLPVPTPDALRRPAAR